MCVREKERKLCDSERERERERERDREEKERGSYVLESMCMSVIGREREC